jgi:hypothetical protein
MNDRGLFSSEFAFNATLKPLCARGMLIPFHLKLLKENAGWTLTAGDVHEGSQLELTKIW